MSATIGTEVLELTRRDIVKRLEHGARSRLGISAAEMVRRYRAGTLKDPGRVGDLLILASLLPKRDSLFVPG